MHNYPFRCVLLVYLSSLGCAADSAMPNGCDDAVDGACPESPGRISVANADALTSAGLAQAVDARGQEAFAAAHLAGATVLSAGALRATVDGVEGQVAPPADAQTVFEAAGLETEAPLIIYGDANDTATARVVWTLRYYGHTADVWMLDGGLQRWQADGAEVSTDGPSAAPSEFRVAPDESLRVDGAWVLDHLEDPAVTLIDARSLEEFSNGHIPGAVSVDWVTNLGTDGRFLADADLVALYENPDPEQTLVVYCQTGSRASVDWLVLTMLGYADVRIYDGSWAEWSMDDRYPRE